MSFEVASVRLAKPGAFTIPSVPLDNGDAKPPGGRFSARVSLRRYIFFAYKLQPFQAKEMVSELPKWTDDTYAIDAKAEGNPTKDQLRLMLQSLLADRFKLRVHFESNEVPVLDLVLVTPGKLGPKLLQHSEGPSCPSSLEMDKLFSPIPAPKSAVAWPPQCGTSALTRAANGTWIGSRNITMALLASDLYNLGSRIEELDKPVIDQTGLEGRFDFILELPAGIMSPIPTPPNPEGPLPAPKETSFLNAVRDQLGLKLVRSRGEVRTLIVDHVEKPSEN